VPADWPAYLAAERVRCVARQQAYGAPPEWIEQVPGFLARVEARLPLDVPLALLHGDLHQYHLLAAETAHGWRLTGCFDFDGARLGPREFDLASPGIFMFAGQPDLTRAYLAAYGYPRRALDAALSRRLLACTLLHGYRDLRWFQQRLGPAGAVPSLEALAEAIYGLDGR